MPIPVRMAAASGGPHKEDGNEENQKADCEYRQHAQAIRLAAEEEAGGCVVSELERLSLPADVKCADTT